MNTKLFSRIALVSVAVLLAFFAFFKIERCVRKKEPAFESKKGKTELVSSKKVVTFDTLKWISIYKANTKPKIVYKYLKPELTHDTTEEQPDYHYSPCDSVFVSQDTGTVNGVKFEIRDTTSNNRVTGRSVKLQVPYTQITKHVVITNDSLRVDTVYIKQKFGTNAKWFLRGFGTGFTAGLIIPK
jgi:hypothetical protein